MDRLPISKNWQGWGGLHFIQSLTKVEQEAYKTVDGLYGTLTEKFRPQYTETILS